MRAAAVKVVTVEVLCPYCGDPQRSPIDCALWWTPAQVAASSGLVDCDYCERRFRIRKPAKVKESPAP